MVSPKFKNRKIRALWRDLLAFRLSHTSVSRSALKRIITEIGSNSLGVKCTVRVADEPTFGDNHALIGAFSYDYENRGSFSEIAVHFLTGAKKIVPTDWLLLDLFSVLVHEYTHSLQPKTFGTRTYHRLSCTAGSGLSYYSNELEIDAYGREVSMRLAILNLSSPVLTSYRSFAKWLRTSGHYLEFASLSRSKIGTDTCIKPLYTKVLEWTKKDF